MFFMFLLNEELKFSKKEDHIHQTPEILMPPGAYFIPKFTYAIGVKKKKIFLVSPKKSVKKVEKVKKTLIFRPIFEGVPIFVG